MQHSHSPIFEMRKMLGWSCLAFYWTAFFYENIIFDLVSKVRYFLNGKLNFLRIRLNIPYETFFNFLLM